MNKKILMGIGLISFVFVGLLYYISSNDLCKNNNQCPYDEICKRQTNKCEKIRLGSGIILVTEAQADEIIKNNKIGVTGLGHDGLSRFDTYTGDANQMFGGELGPPKWEYKRTASYIMKGGSYNILHKYGKEALESWIE